MRKRNLKKIIIFVLILCISIGFAVLTATLSMNASFSFTENSFNLYFSNINILNTSTVTSPTATITDDTTITYSGTFNKPGDYIEFSFYIINNGTIDGQINTINTGLTTEQAQYIDYNFKYAIDNSDVNINDIIAAGQARKVIAHFEYKEDIDDFIDLSSLNVNLTMHFIQPQTVTTTVWNYEYLGTEQYYIVPKTGTYKIELWGASGSGTSEPSKGESLGGKGAYTSGKINLNKNQKLYVYVGQGGSDITLSNFSNLDLYAATFNGGGAGAFDTHESGTMGEHGFVGGGATDVRIVGGTWNNFDSLKTRIMVAGAGGGGGWSGNGNQDQYYIGGGGYAGGLSAPSAPNKSTTKGGTQTTGNKFGIGGNAVFQDGSNNNAMSAGGGGYFGGMKGASFAKQNSSGAGGSSYISGHIGCVAIEETSTVNNITFPTKNSVACNSGTINIECSKHYLTDFVFTETKMIDGGGYEWKYTSGDTEVTASSSVVGMPTHDGTGTMTGNTGNGFAKITFLG